LPIGGLKEKVLGAHRAGITTIILPRRNEGDLEDLPAELREQMQFVPVETIDQVLAKALLPAKEGERPSGMADGPLEGSTPFERPGRG
jgi:ATP-dependent Lon protease